MSAPQPLTGDELAAIKARATRGHDRDCSPGCFACHADEDVPRLVAEVESLRAALNFKQGTIDDLAATVERLEAQVERVREVHRPIASRHNHLTRDIKPKGQCPRCDIWWPSHPETL